jgi:hypothetical protein
MHLKELSWHRNGIAGVGFHAVLFRHDDYGNMLAIVFDEPGHVAVLCLDQIETVEFGKNSWRGDQFEAWLREQIATQESSGSVRVGPFGLPTITEPQ